MYGTNFTLTALFLTAEKCGEILVALKIGRVKLILLERLCAISNTGFAYVKFGCAPFVKAIMRSGAFADLRPFEKIRALKFLVFYRFGEKFSLDRLDDGLRREIFHAGVGF